MLGQAAAREASSIIRAAIELQGKACVVAATGASQFEFLDALALAPDVEWKRVTFFHLDEYVGISDSHPASFRKYLRERIAEPLLPGAFHFINGESKDPQAECRRLGELISRHRVDAAFVGIGENCHLAFNDPPADFETKEPYIVVQLDEQCCRQQVDEGWFKSLEEVPRHAISMSVRQILNSQHILCVVPDQRKAEAVRNCLERQISPDYPASILRHHPRTTLYLDYDSSSLLKQNIL